MASRYPAYDGGVAGEAGSGLMTIVNWPRHWIVTARTQMAQFAGISPDLQTSPRNTQKLYCKNIFIKVIMDIELAEHELPPALYVGEGNITNISMNNLTQKYISTILKLHFDFDKVC